MKSTSKLTIFVLTFLTLAANTFAQEPSQREQFQTVVATYQKSGTEENALKLAELYKQLDPSPAIPADAEYHADVTDRAHCQPFCNPRKGSRRLTAQRTGNPTHAW